MFKIFKLLFFALCDVLEGVLIMLIIASPIIVASVIVLILKLFTSISNLNLIITSISICIIGYFLMQSLPHCFDALKYHKEIKNISLKEAWNKTYPKEFWI